MDRRRFLVTSCVALPTAAAGCLNSIPSGSDQAVSTTETASESRTDELTSTDSPMATQANSADEIMLEVVNRRADSMTVTVSIATDGEEFFERTIALDPDEHTTLDPELDEEGAYELTVSMTGGSDHVRPFSIDSYNRRTGSNLIVDIGEEIRVLIED